MRSRYRDGAVGALAAVIACAALVAVVGGAAGARSNGPAGAATGTSAADAERAAFLADLGLETVGPPVVGSPSAPAKRAATPKEVVAAAATPRPTPTQAGQRPPPGCPVFPSDNPWNERVDTLPVASNSSAMISAIGLTSHLHPDFSDGGNYGIPYNLVDGATPRSTVTFQYASESDKVGYPIPANPLIEGGSDAHLLMIDTSACKLYELFAAKKVSGKWKAGSGAVWDLRSNAVRPDGWTSADAAGLPIFPGLVRYDQVAAGAIKHALRFTAPSSCAGHIYPARHDAGSGSCSAKPPMGLRVRLKASFNISGYTGQARVVLLALKQYGMLLADNGSAWYVTGAPNSNWDDDNLHTLNQVPGSAFEVVNTN
jgi:hypothetical protein